MKAANVHLLWNNIMLNEKIALKLGNVGIFDLQIIVDIVIG